MSTLCEWKHLRAPRVRWRQGNKSGVGPRSEDKGWSDGRNPPSGGGRSGEGEVEGEIKAEDFSGGEREAP